ncbi:putative reverse transcriptase domain-containing protein [Tanacetum coccineum]
MEEINNFQQEPNENLYQAWERFKELLMKCHQHYLTEMQEVVLFYNGLNVPTRQILDSRGAIPSKSAADARIAIQEMAEYSQKLHNGTSRVRSTETSDGLATIQAQLNNLGREIKKEGKTLEEAYYTQFGGPFQGGGYRATAPGYYQRNNANPSYQERRQSMEDTQSKFMSESAKRNEENSNLIKEIQVATDVAIRNQGASIKTLEIQIGQMSKVLPERGFGSLPSSTKTNLKDQVKSISTTIKADSHSIRRIGSSQYAVSTGQNSTLLYRSRQTTIPFPSRLDNHYCEEEEGNYGLKFAEVCGVSHINDTIPRKEKDTGSFTFPCYINNVCFDNALVDLGASVSVMPLLTYLNLGLGELAHTRLTVELADRTVKYPKGIAKNLLVGIGKFTFPVDFIILDMPDDIKVPLILGRPFLSTARAKIDVYKRKITLRVGEERTVFTSVKLASSLIKRVYMLSLRERMELDLEARLMGETLVLNRSLDPFLKDYIELNDLNEPFELKRNQGDDLIPTIKEGEVIEEFRIRNEDLDTGIDDYPSYCDDDKKIHIDCAHNLKFSCMIGFEFTHANFFPLLYVNMMSRKFHNSIMKNKMVYKGNNVVGALMNVPIFVGTFSVMTDFAVLENMDAYRDEGMGDVIFGEPFLREADIKAKRFEGMITLYKGDDEVTYQMVRSHPRFKHHTNEQCNKIPPLLKVNEKDVINGVSHAYQKLKGFYKGVLNLGPCYIQNAKIEEWLTRGHISVHEPIRRIHQGRYGVSVPALTKDHKRNEDQYAVSRGLNTPYSRYGINIIFWKISNVVPTPRNPQYAVSNTWIRRDLDNSTNNVLIPLDSWTSGLLVYRLPLSAEYGVSTSIGYGVSSSLSNTAYSLKLINTAYPLPLDTAYRLSGTEAKILCMTRSSTNELFTPYKEPEREFRSSRRHFKTLSLDELRSPDFNLLSDQEYSEEEEAEAMAETIE